MRARSRNHRFKAIVFDLDDTLIDSRKDYSKFKCAAISELLRLGVDPSVLDAEGTVLMNVINGKAFLRLNSRSYDEREIDYHLNTALNHIEMENIADARIIPGARQAVEYALEEGMVVAVLTRASRTYTEEVLRDLDLSDKISACVCRDDYPFEEAKPNPISMMRVAETISIAPTECIAMGDHTMDAECAMACGAEFVGVLTGSTDRARWRSHGCDLIIDSVANVPEVLALLLGS